MIIVMIVEMVSGNISLGKGIGFIAFFLVAGFLSL